MTVNELISSGLLESYVLGNTTSEENTLIQQLCRQHPELIREIESIEQGLIALSAKASQPLNQALKEKIASGLAFGQEEAVVHPLKPSDNKTKLYRFALAASLLLFVTSFIYNVLLQRQLNRANNELAQMNADKSIMANDLKIQQAAYQVMNDQLAVVTDPKVKTVTLNGMNDLEKMKALVHWNMESNAVYFDARQLPASPQGMQYQLWAMVDGKPVDMGMIDTGNADAVFQKMKAVKNAQAFAVTIEKAGGSPVPTMEAMCLIGNV